MLNVTAPSLEGFKDWFLKAGAPLKPPFEDPIHFTDISMSFVWYRAAPWQVELYLVKPNTEAPVHAHPGVEQIEFYLAGDFLLTGMGVEIADLAPFFATPRPDGKHRLFGQTLHVPAGQPHGGAFLGKGAAFFAFQRWPNGVRPSSVTRHWEGEPVDAGHATRIAVEADHA